ncbi:MAG TPA: FCD domain-containing protein [Thermohalobaculum sp.]|nr:FCD domain-containing protein [Thermohalobaculum sp.]
MDDRVERRERVDAAEIAAGLRKQITAARFATGERLPPERSLAERHGVARGTVREALRQLEAAGLVSRRAGSGTYVTWSESAEARSVVERTRPLELIDARFAIEPHMVRLAVLHATGHDLEKVEALLARVEDAEADSLAFADADEAFHLELARASQNPLIVWMMQKVHEVRSHEQWARMRLLTLSPDIIALYNRQHREVVEAIRRRDAEAAAQAMKAHLATARASLVEAAG